MISSLLTFGLPLRGGESSGCRGSCKRSRHFGIYAAFLCNVCLKFSDLNGVNSNYMLPLGDLGLMTSFGRALISSFFQCGWWGVPHLAVRKMQ